jgi:hypothetical protein
MEESKIREPAVDYKKKTLEDIKKEEEIKDLIQRGIFVRRGRNNRILFKHITKSIFESYSDEEDLEMNDKKMLKKRKR